MKGFIEVNTDHGLRLVQVRHIISVSLQRGHAFIELARGDTSLHFPNSIRVVGATYEAVLASIKEAL